MKRIPTPQSNLAKDDSNAAKEAESFANQDLEKEAKTNEHRRKEKFKKHIGWAALIIFWIIATGAAIMLIIVVYHLITPERAHFLNALQTDKLQTILLSAFAVKISQSYWDKYSH